MSAYRFAPGQGRTPRVSPTPLPPVEAFPGVACHVLTRAIREVEAGLLAQVDAHDRQHADQILAAVGFAVDQRSPAFLAQLSARHSPVLALVINALRAALLRAWSRRPIATVGAQVLRHLAAIEELQAARSADAAQEYGAYLAGPDGAALIAEVVHDLRSPLTSILFLAQAVERGQSGPLTELQRRQMRLVYTAALRLAGVVSDAIELAHGGPGLATDEAARFSITQMLSEVSGIVRPIAEEKGLTIQCVVPPHDCRNGQPLALHRVLLNLVSNALKFTHHGGVTIRADEAGPTTVRFAVQDTGPGIAPGAVATLYQPFHRGPAAPGYRFSSTGLGLAVSRRLVTEMGGVLEFESVADQGTRFWFDLDVPPG
ncbi:MAG TPA: HAMP domain-containing sensor histidine kinase [Gemmatimonadales bacterium]